MGGPDQAAARHHSRGKSGRRRQFARRGVRRAFQSRRLYASAWRIEYARHRSDFENAATVRSDQRSRTDIQHCRLAVRARGASFRSSHDACRVHQLRQSQSRHASYGHAGVGWLNHLTGELFKSLAGLPDLLQEPYRGSGPAIADALAGHVSMVTPAVTGQMIEFHRTGRLRILAVTSPNRLSAASDLPTAAETLPEMIFAPAGTAKAIIDQIAQANHALLAQSDYQKMLIETGFEPDVDSSPEIFRRRIAVEISKWTPIGQALGIKID
ncbi:MAG TPA: tripartite tricarboxylate transporter substrate-binding protein [Xanthobacteraceae bacterium]|nr:tripartite tricarboxylate transporter substrate-binding protein [Xanthobacteraceae bacterium]